MQIPWQVRIHVATNSVISPCCRTSSDLLQWMQPGFTSPPKVASRLFTGKPGPSAASPASFFLGSTIPAIAIPSKTVSITEKILLY